MGVQSRTLNCLLRCPCFRLGWFQGVLPWWWWRWWWWWWRCFEEATDLSLSLYIYVLFLYRKGCWPSNEPIMFFFVALLPLWSITSNKDVWVKLYMTPFENIIHLFGHMLNFGAATWIPSQGNEIVNHLLCTSKVSMKVALLTTLLRFTPLAFFWWGAWWALRPYPTPGKGCWEMGLWGLHCMLFFREMKHVAAMHGGFCHCYKYHWPTKTCLVLSIYFLSHCEVVGSWHTWHENHG